MANSYFVIDFEWQSIGRIAELDDVRRKIGWLYSAPSTAATST
jgi:hypothetical protein